MEELDYSKQLALFDLIDYVVLALDNNHQIVYWNQAAENLFGFTAEEAIGKHEDELSRIKSPQFTFDMIHHLVEASGSWHGELEHFNKDQKSLQLEWNIKILELPEFGRFGTLCIAKDITEQKRAVADLQKSERELKEQKNFFEQMFLQSSISTQILDKDGWCLRINPKLSEIFGVKPEHIEGGEIYNIFKDEGIRQGGVIPHLEKVFKESETAEWEVHFDIGIASESQNIPVRDKKKVWYSNWAYPIFDDQGHLSHAIIQHTDITDKKEAEQERNRLQEQLLHSQKMESIGRLAGGVAHDFNNLITGINGYAQMILDTLAEEAPMRGDVMEILKAGERAASLTAQLLAFSRKQIISPTILDLAAASTHSRKMLHRIIGEDITLTYNLPEGLGQIKADAAQLDQVLMNLTVNARDAMPDGGVLIIEARNVTLKNESLVVDEKQTEIDGEYVMLAVTDNGIGMDKETEEHAFEPFYSTKSKDKGTGLGLAMVYGIMRQNNGFIKVTSKKDVGTSFTLYFPRVDDKPDIAIQKPETFLPTGDETVLLVEDEEMVRHLGKRILENQGYKVIEAENGMEACRQFEKHLDEIQLLITDVVMPDINGLKLSQMLAEIKPGFKVLYMSGYTDNVIAQHGILTEVTNFIQKPFRPHELAKKVRGVLDEPSN